MVSYLLFPILASRIVHITIIGNGVRMGKLFHMIGYCRTSHYSVHHGYSMLWLLGSSVSILSILAHGWDEIKLVHMSGYFVLGL